MPSRSVVVLAVTACSVVAVVSFALVTARVLGWQVQVIRTGSMAPRLPSGSLVVVRPVDAPAVRPGMTIVFEDPATAGRLVAHRVVSRLPAGTPAWVTKGDANRETDPFPVTASALRGRVAWAVPWVGGAAARLHHPVVPVVLIGVPLLVLALTEWRARQRTPAIARSSEAGERR